MRKITIDNPWLPRAVVCGLAIAVIFCALFGPGLYMMATGSVLWLHPYHYAHIASAELPVFAAREGLCIAGLAIGSSMAIIGVTRMLAAPAPCWAKVLLAAGGAVTALSLCGCLGVIIIFNGTLL